MKHAMIESRTGRPAKACTVLALLTLTSCALLPDRNADREEGAAQSLVERNDDSLAPFVATVRLVAEDGAVMPRSFTGVVKAARTSELGFKRTGRVERMLVTHGDVVKKGDVLAELDTAALLADLAVTDAERQVADARLRELVAGPRKQTLDAARAQVDEIEAQREQLRITFERTKRLVGSEIISQQSADDARLTFAAVEKRLTAQKHLLAELEEGTRSEQIEAAKAAIGQLDAARERLKLEVAESTLRAPFDAIISRRLVDEGAIVAPGLSLVRLVENIAPEAWIGVAPEIAAALDPNRDYTIAVGAREYIGRCKAILPELDQVTRTQTALFSLTGAAPSEADIAASPVTLTLGRIAQLRLTQDVRQPGYWLPLTALTRGARGLWSTYVAVETEHGTEAESAYEIRRCDVEIIQVDSERVLVRGTVRDGDRVVISGAQKLTAGQRVRLAPAGTQPVQHSPLPALP